MYKQYHIILVEGVVLYFFIVLVFNAVDGTQIQIDFSGNDVVNVAVALQGVAVQTDVRVFCMEGTEDFCPDIWAEHTQIDVAVGHVPHGVQGTAAVFHGEKSFLYIVAVDAAVFGKLDVPALPNKEGNAQLCFQFLDGGAEGRLRDIQHVGCFGYVLGTGQLKEIVKLKKFHGCLLFIRIINFDL